MNILEVFDVNNILHLEAYWHLIHKGRWPGGFWPEHLHFPPDWEREIERRLSRRYVSSKLGEFAFSQAEMGLKSHSFSMMEDLLDEAKSERLQQDIKQAEKDSMSCAEWVEACRKEFERVFPSISHFRVMTHNKSLVVVVQPSTWGESMAYHPEKATPILKQFGDNFASDGDADGEKDFQVEKALEAALAEVGL